MPFELILQGRVQGVACRYYCSQYAKRMGIHGAASNLYNGNVQVLLDTDNKESVQKYIRAIKTNPLNVHFWGKITSIDIRDYSEAIRGDYEF